VTDGAQMMQFGDDVVIGISVGAGEVVAAGATIGGGAGGGATVESGDWVAGGATLGTVSATHGTGEGVADRGVGGATLGTGEGMAVDATAGMSTRDGATVGIGAGSVMGASMVDLLSHSGEGAMMWTLGGAEISDGSLVGGLVGTWSGRPDGGVADGGCRRGARVVMQGLGAGVHGLGRGLRR
jgi:hypothetical protein